MTNTFSVLFSFHMKKKIITRMSKTARDFQVLVSPFVFLVNSCLNYGLISKGYSKNL